MFVIGLMYLIMHSIQVPRGTAIGTKYNVMNGTKRVSEITVSSVTKQQSRRGVKEQLKNTARAVAGYTVHENITLLKMLGQDRYKMYARINAYVQLVHDFTGIWRAAVAKYFGVCVVCVLCW